MRHLSSLRSTARTQTWQQGKRSPLPRLTPKEQMHHLQCLPCCSRGSRRRASRCQQAMVMLLGTSAGVNCACCLSIVLWYLHSYMRAHAKLPTSHVGRPASLCLH